MYTHVRTLHSEYEVCLESRRIRRLVSDHAPTPHQFDTADGDWKPFLDIAIHSDCLMIVWSIDHEDALCIARRTFTSPIMSIDGPLPAFTGAAAN